MVDVIGKIIDIDKNAKSEVITAREKADSILVNAAARKEEMKKEYDDKIRNRLEIVKLTYNKLAEEDIAQINARKTERVTVLEKAMGENRDKWEKQILASIIG